MRLQELTHTVLRLKLCADLEKMIQEHDKVTGSGSVLSCFCFAGLLK